MDFYEQKRLKQECMHFEQIVYQVVDSLVPIYPERRAWERGCSLLTLKKV
jgi:hypothetical protein